MRDFMIDGVFSQQDKTLRKYLKPDLVIIDDMGLKALPKPGSVPAPRPGHRHHGQKLPDPERARSQCGRQKT
ncbi:MAG TPA: hypothetical protein VMV89_07850, partial [Candidatus Paceibacterota bacterium]|nr:hypothetical protein [Candidatus Paceibacterota bacterium]